jgi:Protein tyrosine and serine/threonine kinase
MFAQLCAGEESSVPMEIATRWTPPEIQKARDRKQDTVTASTAVDMWAFGIVAHELLTGKTAFPPGLPRGTIRRMLHGKAPLPWEDHAHSSELTDELADNELKGIVLSCLARKPDPRPAATALVATFKKHLAVNATPAEQPAAAIADVAAGGVALAGESADTSRAVDESMEISGSFLRAPLRSRSRDDSAAVGMVDSNMHETPSQVDGALRVGPAGLAVSAKHRDGSGGALHALDNSASVMDTLDTTDSFKALAHSREGVHVASGELLAGTSVTAAIW